METDVNVQDRVELPEPETLDGVKLHEVLFVVRLTRPLNELIAVIVIVDFPVAPTLTFMLV